MKYLAIIIVALGIFAGTAQAGSNQNPCPKNWPNLQSASGGTFSSIGDCASSRGGVFNPSLSVSPLAVTAWERLEFAGSGFHPLSDMTLSIAVTGLDPYYVARNGTTLGDGTYIGGVMWSACGAANHTDMTLTLTDAFGVHASAHMTLC